MTVSHHKVRPAKVSYYLREQDLRKDNDTGSCSSGQEFPLAEWMVYGPTDHMTSAALELDSGPWKSPVDAKTFKLLAQGFARRNGLSKKPLVQNAGSPKRVALHDFTLSAPKSVSVVWALSDQITRQAIEYAQQHAAHAFLKLLGRDAAYSRQGRAGCIKTPCSLVAALFPHFVSRSADPQLHTHCTFLNVAVRPDGTTGSLETLGIMGMIGVAATRYHEALAENMQEIGFGVQQKGKLFEIEGVSDQVCLAFSQRRTAALLDAHAWLSSVGKKSDDQTPSRALMRKSVLRTRPAKKLQSLDHLRYDWLQRAELSDFEANHCIPRSGKGHWGLIDPEDEVRSSRHLREVG